MSRSWLSYSLTLFEYLENVPASSKKVFWKRLNLLMMDTFVYRTLLENSVDIHHREFYYIKITSFKSSNKRVYQGFLALGNWYYLKKSLGNNFWIVEQLPNGPTTSYATGLEIKYFLLPSSRGEILWAIYKIFFITFV